jgi:hypothetical protein
MTTIYLPGHALNSLIVLAKEIEELQHAVMLKDITDEQLALIKSDLNVPRLVALTKADRWASKYMVSYYTLKVSPEDAQFAYQAVEVATHLLNNLASSTLLPFLLTEFDSKLNRDSFIRKSIRSLEEIGKEILKKIPVKHKKELLEIDSISVVKSKAKSKVHSWYIHTLDGMPAIFNGRTIVPHPKDKKAAPKWPPCASLRSLRAQQEKALNIIKQTVSIQAAAQFKSRIDYVAYQRVGIEEEEELNQEKSTHISHENESLNGSVQNTQV